MRRSKLAAIATAALGGLILAFAVPTTATASEVAAPERAQTYELTAEQEAEIDAVLLGTDTTATTFNADVARAAGADEDAIADYAVILDSAGWEIVGGYEATGVSEIAARAAARCTGVTKYTGYFIPIGNQWALNSCDTDTFIAALKVIVAGGSGTAAVALLTKVGAPVAAVSAAVAGLAGLGVAVAELCKTASPKKAIYINAGGTIPASCWGQ